MEELTKATVLANRKYIQSDAGRETLLYLRERIPSVKFKSTPEEAIFDAGKAQGYRECLDDITSRILELNEKQSTNFEN